MKGAGKGKKRRGFWDSPAGLRILDRVYAGEITPEQAAKEAGTSYWAVTHAMHRYRLKHAEGVRSAAAPRIALSAPALKLERLVELTAEFLGEETRGHIERLTAERDRLREELAALRAERDALQARLAQRLAEKVGLVSGD